MARHPKQTPVEPLPGLAPWAGGKRHLARRICARIENIPHESYAEPFIGMGGLFFRRRRRPKCEVLNDWSGEVVNLFRVVKHHPAAFLDQLQLVLFARESFEQLLALPPEALTDVQRAARFYWMQRCCYSGLPGNRSFPPTPVRNKAISRERLVRQIEAAHRRLAAVTVEHMPYAEFLAHYDRPGTLFYLDPPYWGREAMYGKGMFERADFERLAGLLRRLKGRFILSLNDVPEIRELFAWARIDEEAVTYKFKGTKQVTELVITGPRRRR